MKITIDATYILNNKTGIGYYTEGLINSLIQYDKTNDYTLFYNCLKPQKYRIPANLPQNFKNKFFKIPRRYLMKLWNLNIFPNTFILGNPDIFICTGLHIPCNLKSKKLSIVYDLSFLVDDFTYTLDQKKKLDALIKKILDVSNFIITTSINTKNDLIKFYQYPQNKIEVVYGALINMPNIDNLKNSENIQITNILNNEKITINNFNYFLFVGSLEKRKNLSIIIKAVKLLNDKSNTKFIFAGKPDNDYENLKKLIFQYNLTNKFIFTGYIDNQTKWRLYKNCCAVLYPSVYEGFGYPILEAYYFNKPIITTRCGSIPELAGETSLYIEFDKPEQLSIIIQKFIENQITINYTEIKSQLSKFNWRLSISKFLEIYNKL